MQGKKVTIIEMLDKVTAKADEKEDKVETDPKQIVLQTKLRIRKSCGHKERIGEMF